MVDPTTLLADMVFTDTRVAELQEKLAASIREHLNISADLLASPAYPETTAANLKVVMEQYLADLKSKKLIVDMAPVKIGMFASSVLLKDKGRYPHHRATANFTNGVQPRTAGIKGKWRRAKPALRAWLASQRDCLAIDASVQPVPIANQIVITAVIDKPLAEDM